MTALTRTSTSRFFRQSATPTRRPTTRQCRFPCRAHNTGNVGQTGHPENQVDVEIHGTLMLLGDTECWCLCKLSPSRACVCRENDHGHGVETEQNKVFQHLVLFLQNICDKREADIAISCPAERQRDESTWPPTILNVCETELEEVDAHERRHHQNICSVHTVGLETDACPVSTGARKHDRTRRNHQAPSRTADRECTWRDRACQLVHCVRSWALQARRCHLLQNNRHRLVQGETGF